MSKKTLILFIASLLAIPFALADTPNVVGKFGDMLVNNLSWLFVDFGTNLVFWMRLLLGIALFAVFYAVLIGFVPPFKEKKNLSIVVAIIMGIICVVFIPEAILRSIGQSYGIVAAVLFMAVPVGGLIYLMHSAFPTGKTDKAGNARPVTTRRMNHAIKAIVYYLIFTILGNYFTAASQSGLFGKAAEISQFWEFAEGVCIIMMFYHLFAAIFITEGGEEGEEGWLMKRIKEGAGKAAEPVVGKKEAEKVDLAAIRDKIGTAGQVVAAFENKKDDFATKLNAYVSSAENERAGKKDDLLKTVRELKDIGAAVEISFAEFTNDAKIFGKLEDSDLTRIAVIARAYRTSLSECAELIKLI